MGETDLLSGQGRSYEYLWQTQEFGFKESEVLVIHTDQTGEVTQKDLDKARQAVRDIDKPGSQIKTIVSVRTSQGEVNWIIETKGRVWEDTDAKDTAMRDWCARTSQQTGQRWEYTRVNQAAFEAHKPQTLVEAARISGQASGGMTL